MQFTRRGTILGIGAASGLVVAWALTPRTYEPPIQPGKGEVVFDAWLKIGSDGVIAVAVPQLEMGQGITTLIPQIVAEELGADWRQVAVEPAPLSGAYANTALAAWWAPLWMPFAASLGDSPGSLLARRFAQSDDFVTTADGMSLAAYELPARIAAANARVLLAKAAAAQWGVAWEECDAQGGFIVHNKQRLSFGELAQAATEFDPPGTPVIRSQPASERAIELPAGAKLRYPRLDLPAKVDGSMLFAGDVRLPDMVYAAVRNAPIADGDLAGFDTGTTKGLRGLIKLVAGKRWLAAVATDWWAAERALSHIAPRFAATNRAESAAMDGALEAALRTGAGERVAQQGDPDAMFAGPKFDHVARYRVAPALHATLETATATARWRDGALELWVASQSPEAVRRSVAAALGIETRAVTLFPMPAGGSFDRRLEGEHAVQAAVIAKDIARPVQLVWSRWQEHLAGLPRPPASAVLAARVAPDGSLVALKTRIAVPAAAREFAARNFDQTDARSAAAAAQAQPDPLAIEGAVPPYRIEHLVVEHVPVAIGMPTGRMRGNAHGYTCFFTECFIDELAHRSGREPLSYRMAMLGDDLKLAQCLQRAASLASWNGATSGTGQGLACHTIRRLDGTGRIALIASARRGAGGITVDKLTAVVDLGRIVNLDIARQQIEGGLIFGLGLATGSSTAYADGLPLTGRLGLLGLPLLANCPAIDVEFIESDAVPFDPGELGVAVVAPAIANAVFSASGARLRSLPLLAEEA